MSPNWLLRKPAAQAVLVFPLLLGLAGCSSSVYGPVGPAPADSVTFPAASTRRDGCSSTAQAMWARTPAMEILPTE